MAHDDDPVRVGATLKALREAYGWQLGKFALTFDPPMTHGHLANIEAGRKRLSPQRARQAAKTLGVPLAAIMTGRDVEDIAS